MGPISVILAVVLVGSHGLPQIDPASQDTSVSGDPSTLISPWSQWMSLKAPPISLAMPKKKKLLPGPPPPPGTPEAPWTTWTRMKISSALSPTSPMLPPAPPPSPISDTSANSSEPSVWIQWTQMKLPMISGSSSSSDAPETPWDAWMKARTSMAAPAAVATGTAPGPSKRMAPDRYAIASTMAPKPALWPSQSQQTQSSGSSGTSNSNVSPSSSSIQSRLTPSAFNPNYSNMMSALPIPNIVNRLPNTASQYSGALPLAAPGSSTASNPTNYSPFLVNLLQANLISPLSHIAPQLQQPRPTEAGSVSSQPASTAELTPSLATALRPLPNQIVAEIVKKGTPQEISSVIQAISARENSPPPVSSSDTSPTTTTTESTVEELLPPTFIPKLSPELRPLLANRLEITPSTTVLAQKPIGAVSVPLSLLPETIREPILEKATPKELDAVLTTLSKIEAIPVLKQAPIIQVDVESVLPTSLVAKLQPQFSPVLKSKLAPPVLQAASLPKPVLDAILNSTLSDAEVSLLIANIEEVRKIAPTVTAQPPPLSVIIPPSILSKLKLPPDVVPLLSRPMSLPKPPSAKKVPKVTDALSAIPSPVLNEIMTKSTPTELSKIVTALSLLEVKVPSESPLIASILPPTLLTKLSPEVKPLLGQKLILPPISVVSTIPEPILKVLLQVATLEEVSEIEKKIIEVQDDQLPVKKPISALLPADVLAKIPPQIAPIIAHPVVIPPKAAITVLPPASVKSGMIASPADVLNEVLKAAPPTVLPTVMAVATPTELSELSDTVAKLVALPPAEKPLVAKVTLEAIMPESLVAKIPAPIVPLLKTSVVLPPSPPVDTVVAPAPVQPKPVTPAIVSVLKSAPPPVLQTIMAVATPAELNELSDTVAKLEALPPSERPLVSKVTLDAIMPKTLIAKIPTPVVPLLATSVIMPPPSPVKAGAVPDILAQKPLEAPTPVLISVLKAAPPPVLPTVMAVATPVELSDLADTVSKLEALPPAEKALVPTVTLDTVMPDTLLAKVPSPILPLLKTPIILPPPVTPNPIEVASPAGPAEIGPTPQPPTVTPETISVLKAAPPAVLQTVMAVATPAELNELSDTVAKLVALPPTEKPLVSQVTLDTILPDTLIAKIPAPILPLLKAPIILPPSPLPLTPTETSVTPGPTELLPSAPMTVTPALVSVLQSAPPPVLQTIMAVATPAELDELSDTVAKLEALPPAEKPLVAKVTLSAIMPETLTGKIPVSVVPLLETPVILPPSPPTLSPATVPTIPGTIETEPLPLTPAAVPPAIVSVLKSAPPAVLPAVLDVAAPAELSVLSDTVKKLEALPPSEKPLVSQVTLAAILPATLAEKLPPSILPLLNSPVVLPADVPEAATEVSSTPVPPTLTAIPEPILSSILKVATKPELATIIEAISELESLPPSQKLQIPALPVLSVIPTTLASKLPSEVLPLLSAPLDISAIATESPVPVTPTATISPSAAAEDKLLVKWAKKILLKTGKPTAPVPGEIPLLQEAWMDWVQLKLNETATKPPPSLPPTSSETTTQYPWTKWLKLKSNVSTEELAASPPTPEKVVTDWLISLEPTTGPSGEVPLGSTEAPSAVSPVTDEKVAETLKELGVEKLDLPPEQIAALLAAIEKAGEPVTPSPIPASILEQLPPASPLAPPMTQYIPYAQPPPFVRPYLPPWVVPAQVPSPYAPLSPSPTTTPLSIPSPSINITEYLIQHKLIPPETPPTAQIPVSTLAKLLEDEVAKSSEESASDIAPAESTERTLLAGELAALTPTKFAALLKQILKDCNRTVSHLSTRSSHSSKKKKGKKGGPISPIGQYYKDKYSKLKGPWAAKNVRALYPIPNQGVAVTTTTQSPQLLDNALPLPKVDTTGTVLDPAFWAAEKSKFLSQLFSSLAKVIALNETQNQNDVSTPSPKEALTKQVNKVLLGDMTRSVKESDSDEDSDEDSNSQEDSDEVNEKKMVLEDDSEPSNVPKEPKDPLHKLFKFGVQKSILSDLKSTTTRPIPSTTSASNNQEEKEMIDRLKKALQKTKPSSLSSGVKPKKPKKKISSKKHHHSHHHHHSKKKRFRPTPPTTTPNPVDFEMLAKALLLDDNVGDPPKSQQGGENGAN